jgi:CRP/FNR family cyclic AMP-dependent transcriptional regulator
MPFGMSETPQLEKPLENLLAEHPFMEGIGSRFLPLLIPAASLVEISAGDPIFHQDNPAEHLFLIQHGRVGLESTVAGRETVKIQTLRAGEAFGWSWLFPPFRWHFSARALAGTRLIVLDAVTLRHWCKVEPEFGYQLVLRVAGVMLRRLQSTRIQLVKLGGSGSPTGSE